MKNQIRGLQFSFSVSATTVFWFFQRDVCMIVRENDTEKRVVFKSL